MSVRARTGLFNRNCVGKHGLGVAYTFDSESAIEENALAHLYLAAAVCTAQDGFLNGSNTTTNYHGPGILFPFDTCSTLLPDSSNATHASDERRVHPTTF